MKLDLEQFRKLDQATRDYHIWSKLQILDGLEKKFAGKWTEKLLVWVGIVFGTAFFGAIASIVLAVQK